MCNIKMSLFNYFCSLHHHNSQARHRSKLLVRSNRRDSHSFVPQATSAPCKSWLLDKPSPSGSSPEGIRSPLSGQLC